MILRMTSYGGVAFFINNAFQHSFQILNSDDFCGINQFKAAAFCFLFISLLIISYYCTLLTSFVSFVDKMLFLLYYICNKKKYNKNKIFIYLLYTRSRTIDNPKL